MSDHWNDLANLIGAKTPHPEPEPERKPLPPDSTAVEVESHADEPAVANAPVAPPRSEAPASLPKSEPEPHRPAEVKVPMTVPEPKPKNHWQKVAGALGLSFGRSEPQPAPPEAPRPADETRALDTSNVPDADQQPPATWQKKPPSMFDAPSKRTSTLDDTTAEQKTVDRPSDAVPTVESLFVEGSVDDRSQEKYDKEHAKRELAALFSEPVDTSLGNLDFSIDAASREEEPTVPRYVDDVNFDVNLMDEMSTDDDSSTASRDSGAPSDVGEEPRRSRRRRRGGRRGRRRTNEERSQADESSDVEADVTSLDEGPQLPADGLASGMDAVLASDDMTMDDIDEFSAIDEDEDEDAPTPAGEERERSSGGRDKRFRNIRSWKDTVGSIVDANIASRGSGSSPRAGGGGQRRRGGSSGNSGRRGGRGRSRRGSGDGGSGDGGNRGDG